MIDAHWELIRLTVELVELYPYDKGNAIEVMTSKDFELETVVSNWNAYLEAVSIDSLVACKPADGVDEEIAILDQVVKYLKEVKEYDEDN